MAVRNGSERVRKRVVPKQITYLLAAHTQAMLLCLSVARENDLPYLFAYKPIPAISRDPKLVTQNTDPMLTKKIQETLGYKPRPKN